MRANVRPRGEPSIPFGPVAKHAPRFATWANVGPHGTSALVRCRNQRRRPGFWRDRNHPRRKEGPNMGELGPNSLEVVPNSR